MFTTDLFPTVMLASDSQSNVAAAASQTIPAAIDTPPQPQITISIDPSQSRLIDTMHKDEVGLDETLQQMQAANAELQHKLSVMRGTN